MKREVDLVSKFRWECFDFDSKCRSINKRLIWRPGGFNSSLRNRRADGCRISPHYASVLIIRFDPVKCQFDKNCLMNSFKLFRAIYVNWSIVVAAIQVQ